MFLNRPGDYLSGFFIKEAAQAAGAVTSAKAAGAGPFFQQLTAQAAGALTFFQQQKKVNKKCRRLQAFYLFFYSKKKVKPKNAAAYGKRLKILFFSKNLEIKFSSRTGFNFFSTAKKS